MSSSDEAMRFKRDLRELIDRYITPTATFATYTIIEGELQAELIRIDEESEKFTDEEMDRGLDEVGDRYRDMQWLLEHRWP